MAIEADVSYGFKGEVTSAVTPIVLGRGVLYSVEGPLDLQVTSGGGGDRAVSVRQGSAWGDGVLSTWNTGAVLNGASVASGSRWDTVVIRREWTPESSPTGTATLMLLQGGSTRAISVSRTTDAGVTTSDQPLALVRFQAGQTAAQEIVDLRTWAGAGGGMVAVSDAALAYLTDPGTQVQIGRSLYTRTMIGGTPQWTIADPTSEIDQSRLGPSEPLSGSWWSSASGWSSALNNYSSYGAVNGPHVSIALYLRKTSGPISVPSDGHLSDTLVGTLAAVAAPRVRQVVPFMYYTPGGGTYGGTAYINPDGNTFLVSASPNTVIRTGGVNDNYSVFIGASYLAR